MNIQRTDLIHAATEIGKATVNNIPTVGPDGVQLSEGVVEQHVSRWVANSVGLAYRLLHAVETRADHEGIPEQYEETEVEEEPEAPKKPKSLKLD